MRSKQKVQDKIGPLERSNGDIISKGFLMAEQLNQRLSSKGESDYLRQLFTISKVVAKTIRDMKDNKSPGVDGRIINHLEWTEFLSNYYWKL